MSYRRESSDDVRICVDKLGIYDYELLFGRITFGAEQDSERQFAEIAEEAESDVPDVILVVR